MTANEKLRELLEKNQGFLKTSDALEAGVSKTTLGNFVRNNKLERVAHGLYMDSDNWSDEMFVIQFRYPKAIFSHETALCLLDLANSEPEPLSVTFETGTNATGLTKEGVKVYKVKSELFEVGLIEGKTMGGNSVRIYNAERTICDLLRSRNNIEIQVLTDAIKDYLSLKQKNIPQLMRYAKLFSVEKIILPYLEVLL